MIWPSGPLPSLLLGPVLLPLLAGELLEPLVDLLVLALEAWVLGPVLGLVLAPPPGAGWAGSGSARRAGDVPGPRRREPARPWSRPASPAGRRAPCPWRTRRRRPASRSPRVSPGLPAPAWAWASGFVRGARPSLGLACRAVSRPWPACPAGRARPASRSASRGPRPCLAPAPGPRPRSTQAIGGDQCETREQRRFSIRIMIIPPHRPVSAGSGRGRGRPVSPGRSRAARASLVCSGVSFCVATAQLVERLGPLVDLLLERLEHLELGGRGDAVAAAATSAAATSAALPAARPAWRCRP